MSDLEYYGTIGPFVAGILLLIYLFRIRAKIMHKVKIRMLQAKAKIHYMTRPVERISEEDVWGVESWIDRPVR